MKLNYIKRVCSYRELNKLFGYTKYLINDPDWAG